MKKKRILYLLLAAVLLMGVLPGAVAAEEAEKSDISVVQGCNSPDARFPMDPSGQMLETAKAVILYELKSGSLVYAYNPDGRIYPSSMVKLMTALVAYEQRSLSDLVSVSRTALNTVEIGSVSAGLQPGDTLTLEQLLYCVMVASANDAAAVVAEHVGGNQENFARLMNLKAAELGCTDTNFTNPHGLHDDACYTTARDVLRVTEALLAIPVLKQMFCAESVTLPATDTREERTYYTTNYMHCKEQVQKYYDERVTGGKTGATDEAGRCLAVTAEGNGMEILAIVMGAEPQLDENGSITYFGSFEEMQLLLDYAFATYAYRQILSSQQVISQYPVEQGTGSVAVRPMNTVAAVLPIKMDEELLKWNHTDSIGTLTAPVEKDQRISTVQVWYGDICLGVTDLVTMHSVGAQKPYEEADRIAEGMEQGSWSMMLLVFWVLLGVALLIMAGLMILRISYVAGVRARRRRRRMNRRRSR